MRKPIRAHLVVCLRFGTPWNLPTANFVPNWTSALEKQVVTDCQWCSSCSFSVSRLFLNLFSCASTLPNRSFNSLSERLDMFCNV